MDRSGFYIPSFFGKKARRLPLDELRASKAHLMRKPSSVEYYDRYMPVPSSKDMDFVRSLLEQNPEKEKAASPSEEAYRRRLMEAVLQNRSRRILSYKSNPNPTVTEFYRQQQQAISDRLTTANQPKPTARHISKSPERTLEAPGLVDNYYLNLLDWGSRNVLAIALADTVYLWDASNRSASQLVTVADDASPVTSVSWGPDGRHLAVGVNNSEIQLWDTTSGELLRTLRGVHRSGVGSLAWNDHVLTTGSMDGAILNHDVRVRSHVVHTYRGHGLEVCGLKWARSGRQLASGGNDDLVHIWDLSMSRPVHTFDDHKAAVKALAWCPFQSNLLATGGGRNDGCIKFWNTNTGARLNSVETRSQVCGLLWSKSERELLSSRGNQLTLCKYPSMAKVAELTGHTSRVLFMAQSPDGCKVASAAADDTLRLWNVFAEASKPANTGFFNSYTHIG